MKMKFKDIAKGLHIVPSTAYRIYKTTGDAELKEKPRFRYDVQKLDAHHELLIIGMLMQNPCMCLHEICNCIEEVSSWFNSVSHFAKKWVHKKASASNCP